MRLPWRRGLMVAVGQPPNNDLPAPSVPLVTLLHIPPVPSPRLHTNY